MILLTALACGTCMYYAMWHRFPPTASWVLIIPVWFLTLSIIRTWTDSKLSAIPRIYIALLLLLTVFLVAPGMIGPPLGFWIPICCLIATCTGIRRNWNTRLGKSLLAVTVVTSISLVGFGVRDYQQYKRMPAAEKEKLLPVWELMEKRQKQAD